MNKKTSNHPIRSKPPRFRAWLAGVGLLVVALGFFSATAQPARAFLGFGDISVTVGDIPRQIGDFIDKVRAKLATAFKISNDVAFKNSLSVFQARFNEEVLTAVSTAAPGQKPLFLTDPKKFFRKVADSAAGDYIDDFTKGVTGRRGPGDSFSSARGRFLITRFLRAQIGDPLEQCRQDCRTFFSVNLVDETGADVVPNQQNEHEQRIQTVYNQISGFESTVSIKQQAETETATSPPIKCENVYQAPTTTGNGPWRIDVGVCSDNANLPFFCSSSAKECLTRLTDGILNEHGEAQAQTESCLLDCRNGVAGAASKAIESATASDIFKSVESFDLNKTPAAIANALRRDRSEFGQLLTAAATLTAAVQERTTGEQTKLSADLLPRTSRVSEQVINPRSGVQASLQSSLFGSDTNKVYTGTGIADILKGVASFINSPVGRLLSNMMKSQCGLNPDLCRGPSQPKSVIGQILFGSGPTGLAGAKLQFAQIGQVELITGDPGRNEISVTEQLTSAGLIDAQFRSAIENKLTVKEALDRKQLDSTKTFGFDQNGLQATNGYSYRALQYLRKFRVTPVGWELAALYSQRFDQRALSLSFLTGQYNLCAQDPKVKVCSDTGLTCLLTSDCTKTNPLATCNETKKFTKSDHQVCSNNQSTSCTQDDDCNGGTCGASPYCGLVDPNWVLKAPQTYCRRQGAGEEILTKEFVCDQNNVHAESGDPIDPSKALEDGDLGVPNCVKGGANINPDIGRWIIARNTETCGDVQSCIAENEDGTCIAYGYCVQERQTFKFDAKQCSPENASCTTYTDDLGRDVSYLANTVDSRKCTAESAGCKWYCSQYDDPNDQWACSANPTDAQTVNFTNKVQTCSATQQGCRQFLRMANNTNLLPNSGFETFSGADIDSDNAAVFSVNGVGWKNTGIQAKPVTADDPLVTVNNTAAVKASGANTASISQRVDSGHALYERAFFASIRARAAASCTATLRIDTDVADVDQPVTIGTDWGTYAAALRVPAATQVTSSSNAVTFEFVLGTCASDLFIDSAQLEEGEGQSAYRPYGTANVVHLSGTRRQCGADDVGCQAYTRLSSRQVVNGTVTDTNRCTEDKVGCATYLLEEKTSVPTRPPETVNIVAPQGQSCSAAHVGCEEFTNLDEVAQGGEGREYYTQVRQCVKPDHPNKSTYYTWIGDAQRGFVLRANDLLQSDDRDSANNQFGPCTNVKFGTSTGVAPQCDDTPTTVAAAKLNCSKASDLLNNPDCAEYYDSGLNVFYRLRSKTVTVSDECKPYRNTTDQTDTDNTNDDRVYFLDSHENKACPAAAASCRAYTGNASRTRRVIFTDTFDEATVANWQGGQPSAQSVNLGGRSMLIPASGSGAVYTKPDILQDQLFGSKTYILSFIAAAGSQSVTTLKASFGIGNSNTFTPEPGQQFSGTSTLTWNNRVDPPGPEWQTFTLGPLRIAGAPAPSLGLTVNGGDAFVDNVTLTEINDSLYLLSNSVPKCDQAEIGCDAYRDAAGRSHYLTSFARLCAEDVVGCEAMIDTQNSSTPFEQTVKGETTPADSVVTLVNDRRTYCPASAKGCQALGSPTYAQDSVLSGFRTVYLKNDPDRHTLDLCSVDERSCRVYTTSEGASVFFKDPGNNVCEYRVTNPEQGGLWFVRGTSFRCPTLSITPQGRPVGASCSPVCAAGTRAGKSCVVVADCPGSTCVGDVSLAGRVGNAVGQCTNDAECLGGNKCVYQAGSCPEGENGCTEYRDPSDPVGCRSECPLVLQGASPVYVDQNCVRTQCLGNSQTDGQNCQSDSQCGSGGQCVGLNNAQSLGAPGCRAYTYLRQSIETQASECNGQIDVAGGCRPFNDTSRTGLNFRGQ